MVVRVGAAGVNPVDATNRADPSWAGIEPPYVVGYEFAGWIEEVGPGVARFARADAVWGVCPVRGDGSFNAGREVQVSVAQV